MLTKSRQYKKRTGFIVLLLFIFQYNVISQDIVKKQLTTDLFEKWERLSHPIISDNGHWISYEIEPQQYGDGMLYIQNVNSGIIDSFIRGTHADFASSSKWIYFRMVPAYQKTREMKMDKKEKEIKHQDSLAIYRLDQIKPLLTFPRLHTVFTPCEKNKNDWIAALCLPPKISEDTIMHPVTLEKALIREDKEKDLHVINPLDDTHFCFENVKTANFSPFGKYLAFSAYQQKDTAALCAVIIFNTENRSFDTLFIDSVTVINFVFSHNEKMLALLIMTDTNNPESFSLRLYTDIEKEIFEDIKNPDEEMIFSRHKKVTFAENNKLLFLQRSYPEKKTCNDTLPEDEKYQVDIWSWTDPFLQSQQKNRLKDEKKRSFASVYHINEKKLVPMENATFRKSVYDTKTVERYALIYDELTYAKELSWEGNLYCDVYLLDLFSGEKKLILERFADKIYLSPFEKYILYYLSDDSAWYSYSISEQNKTCLTCENRMTFVDHNHDLPKPANAYGFAGWYNDGRYALINGRYDIWRFDMSTKQKRDVITDNNGKNNQITYRIIHTDTDERCFAKNREVLLYGTNENNKDKGIYALNLKKAASPQPLHTGSFNVFYLKKAKNEKSYLWQQGTFKEYPDLYCADATFSSIKKLTAVNEIQKEYLWGSVTMVEWADSNDRPYKGLLYLPEDFDPTRRYPMIVYFYAKHTDEYHYYHGFSPSRSVINIPFYLSNGYIIFSPDIHYSTGHPGDDALQTVVSGTKYLISQGFVDEQHIGLQGQSWGGYQVAYIVTRTSMFAAAMAGAPVSNMTSAYGGIRWESGMSRMFQYEKGQSRIGATLWDNTELYIKNSPVFKACQVETPLLIMHNDNDGAVPWYQGIELFVGLRRLNKPVWMLVYNNEEHNLTQWPNRVDLSIRMKQFFDHYLIEKSPPAWMTLGIPALEKGINDGYQTE